MHSTVPGRKGPSLRIGVPNPQGLLHDVDRVFSCPETTFDLRRATLEPRFTLYFTNTTTCGMILGGATAARAVN